jgi:hypothetical protein
MGKATSAKNGPADVQPAPEPEYLTKLQVAEKLRRNVRTVENYMRRGILPYYKLGHTVQFRWCDIQKHLETHFKVCQPVDPLR